MIALFIYLLCIVCWLGGMVFFSIITAPVIFTRLPLAEAGKVVAGIFPRYYTMGYVAGGLGLVLGIYLAATRAARIWWVAAAFAIAAALAITLYAGIIIRPQVDSIRTVAEQANPDPAQRAEFDRLHHRSVLLNTAVMVLDLAALFASAGALTPRG